MATLIDLELVDAQPRQVSFEVAPSERHLNPRPVVHTARGDEYRLRHAAAVQITLPLGTGFTSLTLSIAFARPMTADNPVARPEGLAPVLRSPPFRRDWSSATGARLLAHGRAVLRVDSAGPTPTVVSTRSNRPAPAPDAGLNLGRQRESLERTHLVTVGAC